MTMKLTLDRQSPVPLYHQIAEAIRYRVATGKIPPGTVLPPLREAAGAWGANMHTVRQAYAELARHRIVETRVPHGTIVLFAQPDPRDSHGAPPGLVRFLRRVEREAQETFGLDRDQLARRLQGGDGPASSSAAGPVYVAECSATQSQDLADQVSARWNVSAVPWPTFRPAPPAGGTILATYFHHHEIARRWRVRLADVHFLVIHPDPGLPDALAARVRARRRRPPGGPITVTLAERDEAMLSNIAADLSRILPSSHYRLVTRLVADPAAWLAGSRARTPLLFSPRLWGEMAPAAQRDPRAVEVRYVFDTRGLDAIGSKLSWRKRR
jgi:DNA-binding transcriptional regulator YhcF (GntR family)